VDVSADTSSDDVSGSADNLRQEIRLAVVMTGGVSLCIWMGGVARELNLLLHSGNNASELARRVQGCYQRLLDLLSADVSVDVLSGTSAGGINAAILGLANVHNSDIGSLRELWLDQGALDILLRDPKDSPTPSLLKGDEQLLVGLRRALETITAPVPGASPADAADPRPTDVFITTTFLAGEPSRFVDDYDTLVSDVDHHGLFQFGTDQLAAAGAADQLALAGRCTASFPVAFEPSHLTIGPDSCDQLHPDMTDLSNATSSCFVADGGLLANRPIAPAVRAVFDRPANQEVRRILLYVVPTAAPTAIPTDATMPLLGAALLRDLSAMTSQAILADLAGIRAYNESVRVRIDTYLQLAAIADRVTGRLVTQAMYEQYLRRVSDGQADLLVEEALRQLDPSAIPLDDDAPNQTAGERTSRLRARVAADLAMALPPVVPAPGDFDALGQLGRRGYDAAKTITLALINRAYLAVPDRGQRQGLARARGAVHAALPAPSAASLDLTGIVRSALPGQPLSDSLADQWSATQQTAAELADGWRLLTSVLAEAVPLLAALLPADDPMLEYLGQDPDMIASRIAQLHIAHTVLLPDTGLADQPLELIQVSADTATDLDPRNQATQKLTGLQLHHFGAFYKYSWRANDWMWGRLDGAGWLVHALLDPRRLRTLQRLDDDPATYGQRLISQLSGIANTTPDGGAGQPADAQVPAAVQTELDALWRADQPPLTSLPETAKWVAAGIQRLILAEELPCVAEQIRVDEKAKASVNSAARAFLATMDNPADDVKARLAACQVSAETLAGEKDSPLFATTFKHTALVAIVALEESGVIPAVAKPGLKTMKLALESFPGGLLVRTADFTHRL
jgi:hypothetical protein